MYQSMEVILIQSTTAALLLVAVSNTEPSDLLPVMCLPLVPLWSLALKRPLPFTVAVASVESPQAAIVTTRGLNRRELLFTALEPGCVG